MAGHCPLVAEIFEKLQAKTKEKTIFWKKEGVRLYLRLVQLFM